MIYIIYEGKVSINSFRKKLFDKVPSSSILEYNEDINTSKRPILTEAYYIMYTTSNKTNLEVLKRLSSLSLKDNVFIINHNKDTLFEGILKGICKDVKVVNNFLSKDDLVLYCMKELKVNESLSKSIVSKCYSSEERVYIAVESLRNFDRIDNKLIVSYLGGDIKCNFFDLYNYLLGYSKRSKKDIAELLFSYRYSSSTIINFLIDKLSIDIDIYDKILKGEITVENKLEYASTYSLPSINKVLSLYNNDNGIRYLIYLRSYLESNKTMDSFGLLELFMRKE